MDKIRKDLLTWRNGLYVATAFLFPVAVYFTDQFFGWFWAYLVMSFFVFPVVAGLLVEHQLVPRPYRNLRKNHNQAYKAAKSHKILLHHYDDSVRQTARTLDAISDRRFSFEVTEVPEVSIYAMSIVDKKCVLIFPVEQSEPLLTPEHGPAHEYYQAMTAASKRLKQAGASGVVRIFILPDDMLISPRLFQFIEKNIADGIDVRMIYQSDVPELPGGLESDDFGYYECQDGTHWVMLLKNTEDQRGNITDYVVVAEDSLISRYVDYLGTVEKLASARESIEDRIIKPVNGTLWPQYFADKTFEMSPPHGLSDEDAANVVTTALRPVPNVAEANVLVLGLTPKLLRKLIESDVGKITSIDQCLSKPREEFGDRIEFKTGNWLEIEDRDFDAIVFDEALNNLSLIQLSKFFSGMTKVLRPGGSMVGRMMGRFDEEQSQRFQTIPVGRAIIMLRDTKAKTHEQVAGTIIPLLHSTDMAFSAAAQAASCERWNKTIDRLKADQYITEAERKIWRLPFNFQLLSPDHSTLHSYAEEYGFSLGETSKVKGEYIAPNVVTGDFFRICRFDLVARGRT